MAKKENQPQEETKPFEKRQPILEIKIDKSKSGEWIIFKTIRTDIVHTNYLNKILNKGE